MGHPLVLPRRPRPRGDIHEELVGDQLFLYRTGTDQAVHCLNSGAAVIWLLCDGTRDLASIAREVSVAYRIPEADVLGDVRTTLTQLNALGLLEPDVATASSEPIESRSQHVRQ